MHFLFAYILPSAVNKFNTKFSIIRFAFTTFWCCNGQLFLFSNVLCEWIWIACSLLVLVLVANDSSESLGVTDTNTPCRSILYLTCQPGIYSRKHTQTHTQPTGDSSYLYIYTFMGFCCMFNEKHTSTHTHTHTHTQRPCSYVKD